MHKAPTVCQLTAAHVRVRDGKEYVRCPRNSVQGEDRHENKYEQLLQWMLGQRSVQALQDTKEGAAGGSGKSFVEER